MYNIVSSANMWLAKGHVKVSMKAWKYESIKVWKYESMQNACKSERKILKSCVTFTYCFCILIFVWFLNWITDLDNQPRWLGSLEHPVIIPVICEQWFKSRSRHAFCKLKDHYKNKQWYYCREWQKKVHDCNKI